MDNGQAAEAALEFTIPDLRGQALTVRGPRAPGQLGVTLPHEHLFIDLSVPYERPELWDASRFQFPRSDAELEVWHEPFCTCRASAMRNKVFGGNRDALILDNLDDAITEVKDFRRNGGGTIVDVTTEGLGRRPLDLLRISEATGVYVIMGTGYYRRAWHPEDMERISIDVLTAMMVKDIAVGVHGTSVRAGVIGELGAEDFADDGDDTDEVRVLKAGARASIATGAPISLHNHIGRPEKWHNGPDVLEREGVDLNRVIAGHVTGVSADIVEALIKRGLYAEFDTLGFPFITGAPPVDTRPNIETIIELINRGYADRILLSQDVCTKFHLHKHGGSGYDFVLTDVAPHLLARGIDQSVIDQLLIHNPARIFAFEAPRSLDG